VEGVISALDVENTAIAIFQYYTKKLFSLAIALCSHRRSPSVKRKEAMFDVPLLIFLRG
jgi:hypothetical protein